MTVSVTELPDALRPPPVARLHSPLAVPNLLMVRTTHSVCYARMWTAPKMSYWSHQCYPDLRHRAGVNRPAELLSARATGREANGHSGSHAVQPRQAHRGPRLKDHPAPEGDRPHAL
eukprot:2109653-Pyramimonas_sp.AAC.1